MNKRKGFTIIEVVLVLAIAGLIFLMVFIALPAFQQSQRNSVYKNNVAIVSGLVQNYKANNRGQTPPSVDRTMGNTAGLEVGHERNSERPFHSYIQNSGMSLKTNVKVVNLSGVSTEGRVTSTQSVIFGRIVVAVDGKCTRDSVPMVVGEQFYEYSRGDNLVWTILEEGQNGLVYCQNV